MNAPLAAGAVCVRPECGHSEDLHDGICFGTACECVRFVAAADALPMPVVPAPQAPGVDPRVELIRRERSHCEAAQFESEDERPLHVWGPSQYPKREMCQRCTVMREWAEDPEATDVVLLVEVDRLSARVAELEAELLVANGVLDDVARARRDSCPCAADRPHQVGCPQDGVPVASPSFAERAARETDPGRRAAWRMLAEPGGEFDAFLRHRYTTSHDRPETGSQR